MTSYNPHLFCDDQHSSPSFVTMTIVLDTAQWELYNNVVQTHSNRALVSQVVYRYYLVLPRVGYFGIKVTLLLPHVLTSCTQSGFFLIHTRMLKNMLHACTGTHTCTHTCMCACTHTHTYTHITKEVTNRGVWWGRASVHWQDKLPSFLWTSHWLPTSVCTTKSYDKHRSHMTVTLHHPIPHPPVLCLQEWVSS